LTQARLVELARELGVSIPAGRKDAQIAKLIESARLPLPAWLGHLVRGELGAACREHGVDASSRSRSELAGALLDAKVIDFDPDLLRETLDVALELAGASGLAPADGAGEGAWTLPDLPAAWQRTLDTIRPPRERDEELWDWRIRPPLPAVFTPPDVLTEDVAHVHLSTVALASLDLLSEQLYNARAEYMVDTKHGLTATYNQLKDPHCAPERPEDLATILHLRQLHEDLDRAVLAAYGWSDIPVPPFCPATDAERAAVSLFEDTVIDGCSRSMPSAPLKSVERPCSRAPRSRQQVRNRSCRVASRGRPRIRPRCSTMTDGRAIRARTQHGRRTIVAYEHRQAELCR